MGLVVGAGAAYELKNAAELAFEVQRDRGFDPSVIDSDDDESGEVRS